jgi:hypothetical protein
MLFIGITPRTLTLFLVILLLCFMVQYNCRGDAVTIVATPVTDQERVEYRKVLLEEVGRFLNSSRCRSTYHITLVDLRAIHFTHQPKAGGTSVHQYMRKHFTDRYDFPRPPHETYQTAEVSTKQTRLFATLFRHPVVRAISLYQYIKQSMSISLLTHNLGVNRVVWQRAHNTSMTFSRWIEEPFVVQFLQRNYFFYYNFSSNVTFHDLKYMTTLGPPAASHTASNAIERTKKKVMVVENDMRERELLARIAVAIPDHHSAYRCGPQMQTVTLLSKRYSAVGQLEDVTSFWQILNARAQLRMTPHDIATAAGTRLNKARRKESARGQHDGYARLQDMLVCEIILWEVAGM